MAKRGASSLTAEKDAATCVRTAFVVGRISSYWLGEYLHVGRQLSVAEMSKITVEYYVIQTLETFEDGVKIFFSLIPVEWVDSKGIDQITQECNFLFPHADSTRNTVTGEPSSWQHKSFKRNLYPMQEWMEYTGKVMANKAGKTKFLDLEARHIKKHCDDKLPFESWTDFNDDGSVAKKRRSRMPARIASGFIPKQNKDIQRALNVQVSFKQVDEADDESDASVKSNHEELVTITQLPIPQLSIPQLPIPSHSMAAHVPKQTAYSLFLPHTDVAPHYGLGNGLDTVTDSQRMLSSIYAGGANAYSPFDFNNPLNLQSQSSGSNSTPSHLNTQDSFASEALSEFSSLNPGTRDGAVYTTSEQQINLIQVCSALTAKVDLLEKAVVNGFQTNNGTIQRVLNAVMQATNALPDQKIKQHILYHQTKVSEHISKTKQVLSVLSLLNFENVCKLDLQFRISLVCHLINLSRDNNTQSICMATCMKAVMSDDLMNQLQWKSRGDDARPGLSVLVHFVSVLGATLTLRCRSKGQPEPSCQDLKKLIQKCRKEGGSRHRKYLKSVGRAAPVRDADDGGTEAENMLFDSEIGPLIAALIGEVITFDPSSN